LIKQGGAGPLTLPTNVNLAQLADINKQLEAFVQLASTVLPTLSTFVPQLKVLLPILPVLTGLLKMGDDIAQAGNDPAKIADVLVAHLKDVAQQLQALAKSSGGCLVASSCGRLKAFSCGINIGLTPVESKNYFLVKTDRCHRREIDLGAGRPPLLRIRSKLSLRARKTNK
jgi:hypothetical protein